MKVLKQALSTALLLILVPVASSAGLIGDVLCGLVPCSETPPPPAVPEPSGALIMGAALLVLAAARRKPRS
jgi:hypothetical protein